MASEGVAIVLGRQDGGNLVRRLYGHRDKGRGLAFEEPAPSHNVEAPDDRLVILGDDVDGKALEVMAVEGPKGELIVIHAMQLRAKYSDQHEEARQCRL